MRARLRRPFYGWYIVGAAIATQGMVSALMFQAFGTYVVLLEREFGWSRTSLAAAFSFARVEDGLLGPLQGWLLDRFGPRWVMRVGFVMFGIGMMLFSRLDSLLEFYATFMFMAVGAALAGFLSITTAVVNWFERRRSLAMGFALLGAPAGGFALPFVVRALETYGWRPVAVVSGVIVIIVGLPLAQIVRHRPQDHGLLPDGRAPDELLEPLEPLEPPEGDESSIEVVRDLDAREFSAREALATRAFWFISLAHAAAVLVVSVVQVHFVAHVNDVLGYSLTQAAALLTLMTTFNVVGRIGGGYLGDRSNTRNVLILSMLGHAVALLLLTFAQSLWMVVAFAVINGLAWGARVPVIIAMRADYFGARSYGTIMGFSSIVVTLGSVSGPVLAGLSYDLTDSYAIGFTVLAVVAGLGSLFLWFLPAPADARREVAARD